MSPYKSEDIRNIVVIGHESSGKTMLTEAMLRSMGQISRMGSIDDGSTVSDYSMAEINRKKSISTVLVHGIHAGKKINLLDTPGFSDFIGEIMTGVRVADAALVVVSAQNGVEVGTESYWEIARGRNLPGLFLINQLDKEHADFEKTLADLKEVFGSGILPLQIPVNPNSEGFNTVIDLGLMKLVTFNGGDAGGYTTSDLEGDHLAKAQELMESLMETVAESDDELLEKFFDAGELTPEEFAQGLSKGILNGKIYPVMCASAALNIGSSRVLDLLAESFPSPDLSPVEVALDVKTGEDVEVPLDPNGPVAALIFKTVVEKHLGELSFFRVYSGTVKPGDEVVNINQGGEHVKFGQLFYPVGKERKDADGIAAGDLGVTVKLKNCHTGDSLVSKGVTFKLRPVAFPEPVHDVGIRAREEKDTEKLAQGLTSLHAEDGSFQVVQDAELNQVILSGQGELHLQIVVEKLHNRFGVEAELFQPDIHYRETITAKADEKYRHKKQSGGAGQFAEVWMRIEPLPRGGDFEFVSEVVGGAISGPFIPAIEKGVRQVMKDGVISGHKVVDVKAIVYDGKEHPVDSKDIAFQIAGREVFKMAVKNAKPIILEPIYDIEVKVPEEYMGDVMGDISSRRGKIQGMEMEGRFQLIKAKVPLADLYRYTTDLRSMTQGRGFFKRSFSHYEKMPDEQAKQVMEAWENRKSE